MTVEHLQTSGVLPVATPDVDILFEYDTMMVNSIQIDLAVERMYSEGEILSLSPVELQDVLTSRGRVYPEGAGVAVLQKLVRNSQRVPVIFSSPQSAWASPEELLGLKSEKGESVSPYFPMITVTRLKETQDTTRFSRPTRRKLAWSEDGNLAAKAPQPIPFNFPYQIDVLSTTVKDANLIEMAILRQWGQRVFARALVNHGHPWGDLPVFIRFEGIRDQSAALSSPDRAEKLIWLVVSVVVEGWIPQGYTYDRTVRKTQTIITNNLIEEKPEILVELPVVTLEDHYDT